MSLVIFNLNKKFYSLGIQNITNTEISLVNILIY